MRCFFTAHETTYGYFNPEDAVEIVNYRLTAGARRDNKAPPEAVEIRHDQAPVSGSRKAYFDDLGSVETRIYQRDDLMPGHVVDGPAIVEQLDTTTPVFPRDRAVVDPAGNLIIQIDAG